MTETIKCGWCKRVIKEEHKTVILRDKKYHRACWDKNATKIQGVKI